MRSLTAARLSTELEPALPPVLGDPVQLQQVLLNLIINAFDAMRKTPGDDAVSKSLPVHSMGNTVEVSVRDFGPGLPADAPDRVFERFFSTKSDGMGMGLAIARSIVEAHDGTLGAENAEGGGARSVSHPGAGDDVSRRRRHERAGRTRVRRG